jgi:hypothetical protein
MLKVVDRRNGHVIFKVTAQRKDEPELLLGYRVFPANAIGDSSKCVEKVTLEEARAVADNAST